MGKRGPQAKPPEDVRGVKLRFAVRPSEAEQIKAAARAEGKSLSDWVRELALAETQ